ncbi:MAG: Hsp70 family protein [Gemmataceae bacterium]|nr:Hsp70 family protein [Gemmataceae bacterium]
MSRARFVIGIDLGTTNCTLAYVDTAEGEDAPIRQLTLPQVVAAGDVGDRNTLPSFLYLPGAGEQPAGALRLPWAPDRDYAVGEFARAFGSQVPTRLVSSAKSWLCHPGVDRRAPILPWKAPETTKHVSPLEATRLYLQHLAEVWNHTMAADKPAARFDLQEVVLTVPASFDAAARELTVEAAKAAGLVHLTLLEEPQAAFYAWLDVHREKWRKQVKIGELILVADLGGGTTDFTLIEVGSEDGNLALTRLAVGDHILLGGDNMDLALAHHAARQFAEKGVKLDSAQMQLLTHSCRRAKETLLSDAKLKSAPVTVLGRGSKVIGGTLQTELSRADVETVLVDGFFPVIPVDAQPARSRMMGLTELGLPYAADPAVTKHLAAFLARQAESLKDRGNALPAAILFNGGCFKADPLRDRLTQVLDGWAQQAGGERTRILAGNDLDLAVSRGAAYYGLVRRGKGVRIRGGTARAYYIGIETALPAVPGAVAPVKALCVAPFGMEEGTEADVPGQEFGLVVGEPVEFRFLGSSVRREDGPGTLVEDWSDTIDELDPIAATLEARGQTPGRVVPVHLHARVTELGLLELSCRSRDGADSWKLEFNVRDR